jgi:hypothetical protein
VKDVVLNVSYDESKGIHEREAAEKPNDIVSSRPSECRAKPQRTDQLSNEKDERNADEKRIRYL